MKFLASKIFPKKFLFLILFVFISCQKNSEHYEYWKNFFEFQNSLQEYLHAENKWKVANGNLNSKNENLLQITKSENLALIWSITRSNSKFHVTQVNLSNVEEYPTNLDNYLLVEYSPSKFKETETYIFRRILRYQSSSVYHTNEIITWIRYFQTQSNTTQVFLNSPLGNFLCKVFECAFVNRNESFIIHSNLQMS
ncbi:MAG: hypothetical protein N3A69_11845 [Leptospiraceae bacterium]|nr:hypothetical protein [Leptospiraceae bacterium]